MDAFEALKDPLLRLKHLGEFLEDSEIALHWLDFGYHHHRDFHKTFNVHGSASSRFLSFLIFSDDIVIADGQGSAITEMLLPTLGGKLRRWIGATAHEICADYLSQTEFEWIRGVRKPKRADIPLKIRRHGRHEVERLRTRMYRERLLLEAHFDRLGSNANWHGVFTMTTFEEFLEKRGYGMDQKTIRDAFRAGSWRRKTIGPPGSRYFQIDLSQFPEGKSGENGV